MTVAKLSTSARRDLLAAVRWLAADSPRAARSLRDDVYRLLPRIAEFPHSGALRPDLNRFGWRFFDLSGMPYVLIVAAEEKPPVVLHILHTSRDVKALLGG